MTHFVTGSAGFIGSSVAQRLLQLGHDVVGVDNLNSYYDVRLKEARLARLKQFPGFTDVRLNIEDRTEIDNLFKTYRPKTVVHLAAQAGVRYSLEAPEAYIDSNIVGLGNILEGCRHTGCQHLLFASSSSVYGLNTKVPFSVDDPVDHPISIYAASKRAGELLVHSYSHLFNIPSTCMRFFTVYGPWGRPDMALFLFTKAILDGKPIKIFNHGKMQRAFTYIDDVVECVLRLIDHAPGKMAGGGPSSPATSPGAPFRVLNIGSQDSVPLMRYIELIEQALGRTAQKEYMPMQAGDVEASWPDVSALKALIDWAPTTTVDDGIQRFIAWYRDHYAVG